MSIIDITDGYDNDLGDDDPEWWSTETGQPTILEEIEASKPVVPGGPYYADDEITLYHGDALEVLRSVADESVNCIVASPPYYGLRDYGEPGQYGAEQTPVDYVAHLVELYHEARRVLAKDGTMWLNLGDSYQSTGGKKGVGRNAKVGSTKRQAENRTRPVSGLPNKNMLGIPWRVALALQDDGWILRNDIIWSKPNGMPQSMTDRLSSRHEHVFMFTKSPRYWLDLDPIREGPAGRNPGDVWPIPTKPFPNAHFATFPLELPRRCIAAGCKPDGTVLDPFSGSGTTGAAALELGRRYVGIDISAEYLKLSLQTRLRDRTFPF